MTLLFVALLVFTRREAVRFYNGVRVATKWNMVAKERRLASLLFCALLVVLALRAALPPHAVDEAIYHLPAPKAFVDAGRIYPLYDNFSGDMPLLAHMFYVVCLIAKADIAARLFSLALAVTTAVALYAFCVRFFTRKMGVLAMFGLFGAGMVTEVAITTRVDVTLAGMGFVALYAMMNYFETDSRGWLLTSALLSGFSLGIKYTAAIWVGLIGVMFIYESLLRKRERFIKVLARGLLFSAVALTAFSPWMVKNYAYFKNPVYPFVTGEVAEYGAQGTRFFNADDESKMEVYLAQSRREIPKTIELINELMTEAEGKRVERHPFRAWEFFTDPMRYQMGMAEGHHEPNYLFFLAPLLLILPKHRWVVWLRWSLWVLLFRRLDGLDCQVLLAGLSGHDLDSCLCPGYAGGKIRVPGSNRPDPSCNGGCHGRCVNLFRLRSSIPCLRRGELFDRRLSRREFLHAAFYYPPIDYINHNSAGDARVMLIGAQMGYHLQRPYLAEVGWDTVEWQRLMIRNDSMEGIYEDIKRQGITHFLYGPGLFRFIAAVGREGSGPSGAMYKKGAENQEPVKDSHVQLRNWATFELFRSKYLDTLKSYKIEDAEYLVLKMR